MIERITYARLYALPDNKYENERFEATAVVQDGDVDAAFDEARQQVEAQWARVRAARAPKNRQSDHVSNFVTNDPSAALKQRTYIARLQNDLGWTSEQLAVYAHEQGIDLMAMTMRQASAFIDGMKRLNEGRLNEGRPNDVARTRPPMDDMDIPF